MPGCLVGCRTLGIARNDYNNTYFRRIRPDITIRLPGTSRSAKREKTQNMNQERQNTTAHQELLMLYQNSVDHIEGIKQRQWTQFYSVLIAQVGLVGLVKSGHLPFADSVGASHIILLLLLYLGMLLILFEQVHLQGTRNIIRNYYRPRLSAETVKLLDDIDKGDYLGSFLQWLYPVLQTFMLIGIFFFFWFVLG